MYSAQTRSSRTFRQKQFPSSEYSVRNGTTDLPDLRVELSTDLETWHHNDDGGAAVSLDELVIQPSWRTYQIIRTSVLPPSTPPDASTCESRLRRDLLSKKSPINRLSPLADPSNDDHNL